jgi:hypothetical protein
MADAGTFRLHREPVRIADLLAPGAGGVWVARHRSGITFCGW